MGGQRDGSYDAHELQGPDHEIQLARDGQTHSLSHRKMLIFPESGPKREEMSRSVVLSLSLSLLCFGGFVCDLIGLFHPPVAALAYLRSFDGGVRRLPAESLNWDDAQLGTSFGKG